MSTAAMSPTLAFATAEIKKYLLAAGLRETDLPLLAQTGEILGRWDGETQQKALADLLSRLDETVFDGAEEAKRLSRADLALGLTAGLFCVLLL